MEEYGPKGHIKIAHISDIHVGSNHFVSNLLNRAIMEINEMEPDVVLVSGDLTNEGFRQEYSAVGAYLGNIRCEKMVVIPGNHDSRNVGYVHFEDLFGLRNSALYMPGVTIVALDSSQPDLNEGRLGRQNYRWIAERFTNPNDFKIVVLHHHLIPLPGTGRERNIIEDAGDFLELLVSEGVDLVLSGHKHVPHTWRFEDFHVSNAGTVSSLRVRGYARPCYSIIEIDPQSCAIKRKYPFGDTVGIITFPVMREKQPHNPEGHADRLVK